MKNTSFVLVVLLFSSLSCLADVVVSSPAPGAAVSSPVHFVASSPGAVAMRIYSDYQSIFLVDSDSLDTTIDLPGGDHHIAVQSWSPSGEVQIQELYINVAGNDAGVETEHPDVAQIQNRPDWQDCDQCAGKGGDGPGTNHYMAQYITSPSLTGSSAQFWVGGSSWGASLWWNQIGGRDDVYRFRYSLDFRVENPENAQALEFDMNQNAGGLRYIYGTECDIKDTHTWRVWNSQERRWVSTGVDCAMPAAGSWNHLAWEFERTGGGVHFTSVTLNGQRHDIDFWFPAYQEGGSGMDVAFQIDLDGSGGDVMAYLDNVGVTFR